MSDSSVPAVDAPKTRGGCAHCGAELPDFARFCAQCGGALPDTQTWHLPVFVTAVVVLFCALMSVQLFATPSFERTYKEFGATLPKATQFVVSGAGLGASVVALLAASLNVWRCKPRSTARLVAAWGAIAVGIMGIAGMILALYLPIFALADAIK